MVGEIGGNDYNYAFFQGKTIEEVRHMVLEIVQAIKDVVNVSFFFLVSKIIFSFLQNDFL